MSERLKPRTIFIDMDGTLVHHHGTYEDMIWAEPIILDGVLEFIEQELAVDSHIIITTARSEMHKKQTEAQLAKLGIKYHRLIMDITAGERVLINDDKPDMEITARAHVVSRNTGLRPLLGP